MVDGTSLFRQIARQQWPSVTTSRLSMGHQAFKKRMKPPIEAECKQKIAQFGWCAQKRIPRMRRYAPVRALIVPVDWCQQSWAWIRLAIRRPEQSGKGAVS
jgi:hypothetical protein